MKRAFFVVLAIGLGGLVFAESPNINAAERPKVLVAENDSCKQGCKKDHRDRVKECNTYSPPESQPEKHRQCLDKAKTKFDACMATC